MPDFLSWLASHGKGTPPRAPPRAAPPEQRGQDERERRKRAVARADVHDRTSVEPRPVVRVPATAGAPARPARAAAFVRPSVS
jgi:hypothetical protein